MKYSYKKTNVKPVNANTLNNKIHARKVAQIQLLYRKTNAEAFYADESSTST
jgi:hypothetical protein